MDPSQFLQPIVDAIGVEPVAREVELRSSAYFDTNMGRLQVELRQSPTGCRITLRDPEGEILVNKPLPAEHMPVRLNAEALGSIGVLIKDAMP